MSAAHTLEQIKARWKNYRVPRRASCKKVFVGLTMQFWIENFANFQKNQGGKCRRHIIEISNAESWAESKKAGQHRCQGEQEGKAQPTRLGEEEREESFRAAQVISKVKVEAQAEASRSAVLRAFDRVQVSWNIVRSIKKVSRFPDVFRNFSWLSRWHEEEIFLSLSCQH